MHAYVPSSCAYVLTHFPPVPAAQFSEMYMLALQPADDTVAAPRVRARVFNLEQVTRMRALDPTDIDTLVAIKGMVIRTNAITPDMKVSYSPVSFVPGHTDPVPHDCDCVACVAYLRSCLPVADWTFQVHSV